MTTRKAEMADLDALVILFDNYRVFYQKDSDIIQAKLFLAERLQSNDSVIFVHENGEKILTGFVQLYPLFSSTCMKKLWLLNDLYVETHFRGLGISIALIEATKILCRTTLSCGMILETAKSNDIGNNLYQKTGFELDSDHNYYSWGC